MSNDAIRRTMFDGYRVNPNFATEHTLLTGGESAYLPGQTNRYYYGGSHDGFTGEPFYNQGRYHFNLRFSSSRWECDDFVNGYQHTTTHQVWVRLWDAAPPPPPSSPPYPPGKVPL